ncbi:hypothetical protein Pyn_17033 [Prunus yedoensis var. nudiflora]|uniref:Uncharacterized protein n=1 Tax=Prunus yedoensis var. nudiflora TaxID=2094558 RepID=A0A314ZDL5_PRUYE|nr:hypothetical protein Pyn_17033 [Prunus yedoensis var. nudiflora]
MANTVHMNSVSDSNFFDAFPPISWQPKGNHTIHMRYEEGNLYGVLGWEVKNMANMRSACPGKSCIWARSVLMDPTSCQGWISPLKWALGA